MSKGQVSTEYLVILAVVLVIALVVVFLVSQGSSVGAGVTETQSKNYWASQTPLAITGYKMSGTTLNVEIRNQDSSDVTITELDVDSVSKTITPASPLLTPGQSQTVNVTSAVSSTCSAGSKFSVDIDFVFSRGTLTGLKQDGKTKLVGTCS